MTVDIPAAGTLVLSWAATYLIHSTCLLAGVWFYLRVQRRAGHALRETLWKGALVGSILSASAQMLPGLHGGGAEVTVSLDDANLPSAASTVFGPARRNVATKTGLDGEGKVSRETDSIGPLETAFLSKQQEEVLWIPSETVTDDSATGRRESSTPGAGAAVAARRESPVIRRGPSATGTLPHLAGGFVLLGVVTALAAILLGVARCLWQSWSLRRKLATCTIISSGPARRLLDELRWLVPRCPGVLLLSADDDPEPAAFGVRQWTIVLPARAVRDLSEEELRALLAHELAHLVRGDSIWLSVSRLICSCLAFQPLNHLARREWQRAAEYLCDSWAVSRTGAPLALARCLAEVAGWRLSGRPSAALLAATGRKSGLALRIERLVERIELSETWIAPRQRQRWVLAGALLLAFVVCCAPRMHVAVGSLKASRQETIEFAAESDTQRKIPETESAESDGLGVLSEHADEVVEAREAAAAPTGEPNRKAATEKKEPPTVALSTSLQSIDSDLNALDRELRELGQLLKETKASPEIARVAERLQREIEQLKKRRDALRQLRELSTK